MSSILEWLRTASLGEIGGALFVIYYGLKALAAMTPTQADDNFLSQVGAALNWIARMARFDPPKNPLLIPDETIDRLKAAAANVEALANLGPRESGLAIYLDGKQAETFGGIRSRVQRRRAGMIRELILGAARENGITLSEAQVQAAVEEATVAAGGLDVIVWILANGPALVALLKALLNLKAEELVS